MKPLDSHCRTVGILHIALGIPGIFAALIVFVALTGGGFLSGDLHAMLITHGLGFVIAGFLVFVHIPGIIAGAFYLQGHSWARVVLLVLGILYLFEVPFGTALGIYTIWALTRTDQISGVRETG